MSPAVFGPPMPRWPERNAAICSRMYAFGKLSSVAVAGTPAPLILWHRAQGRVGLRPTFTICGAGG